MQFGVRQTPTGHAQCVSSLAHVAAHTRTHERLPVAGSVRSTVCTVHVPRPPHTSHDGGSSGGPLAAPGVWRRGSAAPDLGLISASPVRSARSSAEHVSTSRPSPAAAQTTSNSAGNSGPGGVDIGSRSRLETYQSESCSHTKRCRVAPAGASARFRRLSSLAASASSARVKFAGSRLPPPKPPA